MKSFPKKLILSLGPKPKPFNGVTMTLAQARQDAKEGLLLRQHPSQIIYDLMHFGGLERSVAKAVVNEALRDQQKDMFGHGIYSLIIGLIIGGAGIYIYNSDVIQNPLIFLFACVIVFAVSGALLIDAFLRIFKGIDI